MTKILTFRSLNIIRTAGFNPPGFSVDNLRPQINIIYGPNAAGKTTMARALTCLIWPEKIADGETSVCGKFTLGEDNWYVEIDAGKVNYQKDGAGSMRPSFPPPEHRDRYYIALHDLLQKNTSDKSFAEIIITESAGGYQISEAVEELGYKDKPSRRGRTTRKAANKIKEYQLAVKKQKDLADEERHLQHLYEKLSEIKTAKKKLEVVKKAVDYSRADDKYKEIKTKLQQFPSVMQELSGDEVERLDEIKEKIRIYNTKKENAESKYAKAEKTLKEVGLPDEGVKQGFLREIKDKKEKVKYREEKIEQLQDKIYEAESKRKEEENNFTDLINEDKLNNIDGTAYDELSSFAHRAEEVHNKLLSLKNLKNLLQAEEEFIVTEGIVDSGIQYLEEWLSAPQRNSGEEKKIRNISLIASVIILLMSVYMGYKINPMLFILITAAGGIFWYGLGQQSKNRDYRKDAREGYAQLGLEEPDEWETAAVRIRLKELYNLAAKIKLFNRRKQYWEDRRADYNKLKKKEEEINREREKLIRRFGVAPDTDEQTLYHLTNRLNRWQDANTKVEVLKNRLIQSKKLYKKLMVNINKKLSSYGYQAAADAARISGNINDLEARNSKFQEAVRKQKDAESTREEAVAELRESKQQKKELYNNLKIDLDNEKKLRELCSKYDNYIKIKEELSKVEHMREIEKMKLEEYTNFNPAILTKDQAELKIMMKELENRVKDYESILNKISNIETRIETAKEGRSVEEAYADRERALDILEDELYSDYKKIAGKVLAEHICEVNTFHKRPEVFKKARKFFLDISRGNYKLEVSNGEPPAFRAIDSISGKGKSLNELSSGTRIQLLMAVRMAFVDRVEEGISLPLYFDETLANADDSKAEAIIKSIVELVRRGRQCFYFTAQKDEVKKWMTVLKGESSVEYNIIELNKNKKENKKTFLLPDIEDIKVDIEQIPAAGISHEEYGRKLAINNFNPRKGAESAHLWYIIEDLELVSHLLQLGINKWGQFKTLLESGEDGFIPENKRELLAEIKELGLCLEEYVECWRVGRGKLVDRSVLLDSEAVSENFIEEVTELARDVDGNAESIIRKLRSGAVARFLSKKIDELEQYFEEEGYINSGDTLSAEQVYIRTLSVINMDNVGDAAKKIKRLFKRLV